MERESFENEDIAKLLNDNFIPIKVDRYGWTPPPIARPK